MFGTLWGWKLQTNLFFGTWRYWWMLQGRSTSSIRRGPQKPGIGVTLKNILGTPHQGFIETPIWESAILFPYSKTILTTYPKELVKKTTNYSWHQYLMHGERGTSGTMQHPWEKIPWENPWVSEWVISKFNGTSTPKGSYSAKTVVNCPMSLNRVH